MIVKDKWTLTWVMVQLGVEQQNKPLQRPSLACCRPCLWRGIYVILRSLKSHNGLTLGLT